MRNQLNRQENLISALQAVIARNAADGVAARDRERKRHAHATRELEALRAAVRAAGFVSELWGDPRSTWAERAAFFILATCNKEDR